MNKISIVSLVAVSFASSAVAQIVQPWMSPEVGAAWKQNYRGQGTTITVVDDFRSSSAFYGNLTGVRQYGRHGQWTATESLLIAPGAVVRGLDYNTGRVVPLATGINVLNLSYGMMAPAGYASVKWSAQESSIIDYAKTGRAIISKAAGNDGISVSSVNRYNQTDYLNKSLIGAQTAIFVGALSKNGTASSKAYLASYSNTAGKDPVVQRQFLVVGVDSSKTGLAGTSFAAPIVSGYAAILGSKFKTSSPTQITNQLLITARTDTIAGYNVAVHGRGEASLNRALAPVSIK